MPLFSIHLHSSSSVTYVCNVSCAATQHNTGISFSAILYVNVGLRKTCLIYCITLHGLIRNTKERQIKIDITVLSGALISEQLALVNSFNGQMKPLTILGKKIELGPK